jgi:hypothetical protein
MTMPPISPLAGGLGHLLQVHDAETRSISAENWTGEKGKGGMATEGCSTDAARDLGQGWKVSPAFFLKGNQTFTIADIEGSGVIQHIWITVTLTALRRIVLRMYWDGEETPSVEVPIGDFFGQCWDQHAQLTSIPICVNTVGGLNSYWPLPFSSRARITLENMTEDEVPVYFQITYQLCKVEPGTVRFHGQFRRNNPLPYKEVHTLLDGVKGTGHYVGCTMAWQTNSKGWWGEGEIKFYMDGDREFPTICGTGTEDYFGGAYCFEHPKGQYQTYTTPYLGFHQCIAGDAFYAHGKRFGLYRWHILDPIHFKRDLRVTMQALGWRTAVGGKYRYLPLQDDISSAAFWYQTEPHAAFPALPGWEGLEVN